MSDDNNNNNNHPVLKRKQTEPFINAMIYFKTNNKKKIKFNNTSTSQLDLNTQNSDQDPESEPESICDDVDNNTESLSEKDTKTILNVALNIENMHIFKQLIDGLPTNIIFKFTMDNDSDESFTHVVDNLIRKCIYSFSSILQDKILYIETKYKHEFKLNVQTYWLILFQTCRDLNYEIDSIAVDFIYKLIQICLQHDPLLINKQLEYNLDTCLHYLVGNDYITDSKVKIIQLLLNQSNIDVNIQRSDGHTPITLLLLWLNNKIISDNIYNLIMDLIDKHNATINDSIVLEGDKTILNLLVSVGQCENKYKLFCLFLDKYKLNIHHVDYSVTTIFDWLCFRNYEDNHLRYIEKIIQVNNNQLLTKEIAYSSLKNIVFNNNVNTIKFLHFKHAVSFINCLQCISKTDFEESKVFEFLFTLLIYDNTLTITEKFNTMQPLQMTWVDLIKYLLNMIKKDNKVLLEKKLIQTIAQQQQPQQPNNQSPSQIQSNQDPLLKLLRAIAK